MVLSVCSCFHVKGSWLRNSNTTASNGQGHGKCVYRFLFVSFRTSLESPSHKSQAGVGIRIRTWAVNNFFIFILLKIFVCWSYLPALICIGKKALNAAAYLVFSPIAFIAKMLLAESCCLIWCFKRKCQPDQLWKSNYSNAFRTSFFHWLQMKINIEIFSILYGNPSVLVSLFVWFWTIASAFPCSFPVSVIALVCCCISFLPLFF